MSGEKTHYRLGVFVLGGAALTAAAVVLLGVGSFFQKKILAETYIPESVQGLDVGAPVKYRGVRVGEVKEIGFINRKYSVKDVRIRVVMSMRPESWGGLSQMDPDVFLKGLHDAGLRIRMASAGLTGGTYLELDQFDIKEHPPMDISWQPQYPMISSVQSTGTRLTTHVENILEQIEKMKLDVVSEKLAALLDSADKAMKTIAPAVEGVRKFTDEAATLVKDTRRVVSEDVGKGLRDLLAQIRETIEKDVSPLLASVKTTLGHVPGTLGKMDLALDRINGSLKRMDRTLAEGGGNLDETLDNLRVVTQDLRAASEQVKQHPAGALFGEAPPRKEKK